jgi:hypothetical protein
MFFLNFRWFYFKKGNHVCLKEIAMPIWHFFSTVPKCLGAELSFSTGAEMSWCRTVFFNGCRTVLFPFKQELLKKIEKKLSRSLNFTFHSIDDILSLNNSKFGDYYACMYPIASYLELHIETDSEGRSRTKLYHKRDDFNFNFPIVNFPFICSNIPATPAHANYIAELMVPIMIFLIEGS